MLLVLRTFTGLITCTTSSQQPLDQSAIALSWCPDRRSGEQDGSITGPGSRAPQTVLSAQCVDQVQRARNMKKEEEYR